MVFRWLFLAFLLILAPLRAVQGEEESGPKVQGVPQETGMCQRPRWDQSLQLTPDQRNYRQNEEVMLSCPDGLHPSFTEVKCASEVKSIRHGKPVYGEVWMRRNGTAGWIRIQSDAECTELLRVVPESLEVSATSIKLNWTCRIPHACERMQAMCRLASPSSPPCEAEEITGEEMLWGEKGTFTCPLLQPFTFYSVTISLPPSTVLFAWPFQTKETVPDKPKNVSLDASTGLLSWSALPPCKGEILAYQLSITARDARESGFLEIERLRLDGSVTEYALPQHRPGRTYVVTVQGVTAAGAGPVSRWEFRGSAAGKASWSWTAITVILVLVALAFLLAGILWFALSRKKKALISQAKESK
ncbi:uncharacterized protein LOC112947154 [Nothoprocta perdicaria]|uniref:uncharacterized protein LOC112947154 n=1 Tax=Nothoprocta perdicaria TaxID=30464 RepID=UPI000E1BDEE7|nr:uncharacterized protein LOC112947154 [Nothoprocta perdicaria]